MGVLEEIIQMKNKGVSDNEIIKNLQEKGTSPKVINEALNQANIKSAVSSEEEYQGNEDYQAPSPRQETGTYTPQTQEISEKETYQPQQGEPSLQEEGYYPGSPQEEIYQDYQGVDTNTVIEISEQVFLEKIQKIQKQIETFSEFKAIEESRTKNLLERRKKIESIIDALQIRILEKIGSYGQNIEDIKKEMTMMQDSFGKMTDSAAKKIAATNSEQKVFSKKAPGIERKETLSKLRKISKKK